MRAVIQRVEKASVSIQNKLRSEIGYGLLVLLGIESADGPEDVEWLVKKIIQLRIFDDAQGVMNLAASEFDAEILVISQFTLHAKTKKGNRPSYIRAAPPELAIPLYESFVRKIQDNLRGRVATGEFGAKMKVALLNDGPVTIYIDTKNRE
jgi:D-tyrosyl-tRNA(Tyr) deacylase